MVNITLLMNDCNVVEQRKHTLPKINDEEPLIIFRAINFVIYNIQFHQKKSSFILQISMFFLFSG